MSSDIQVGDKVRVTIEDEVVKIVREGRTVYLKNEASKDDLWFDLDEDNFKVEVIEKRVTTFKPGAVVRSKALEFLYTIGKGGYLCHAGGHRWYADIGTFKAAGHFTSEHYELVTLHEPPL